MKKTQIKDAIRNILKKIVSWISLVSVTMITLGTFLGIINYSNSAHDTGEAFYRNNAFHDYEVISNKGITPEEMSQIMSVPGVADVEGFHFLQGTVCKGNTAEAADLISLTERVDTPVLCDGALPKKIGEVAISKEFANTSGLAIGDKVVITASGDTDQYLALHDFVITGIVLHPYYMKTNSSICVVMSPEAFDLDGQEDYYLRAAVKVQYPADTNTFSEDYFETIQPVLSSINGLLDELAAGHDEEIRGVARQAYNEAKAEIDEQIDSAEKTLKDARAEYDKQIAEAKEQIDAAEKEINENEALLLEKEKELEAGKKEYEEGQKKATEEFAKAEKELASAKAELAKGAEEISAGEKKLAEGEAELAKGKEQYESGKNAYNNAVGQMNDAKAQLNETKAQAQAANDFVDTVEDSVELAAAASNTEIPEEYYEIKSVSKEAYKPVVEAQIRGEDTTSVKAEADAKIHDEISTVIDEKTQVLSGLENLTARDLFAIGSFLYGDYAVEDFVNDLDPYFANGFPGKSEILGYLEAHPEYNPTVGDFLELVEDSDFDSGVLDYSVGPYASTGKDWMADVLTVAFGTVGKSEATTEVIEDTISDLDRQKASAEAQLRDAEAKIKKGEEELAAGRAKLEEAKKQYAAGQKQIADSEKKLASEKKRVQKELAEAKKKIEDGEKQISDGWEKLNAAKEELKSGKEEFETKKADGAKQLSDAQAELDAKKKEASDKLKEAEDEIEAIGGSKYVIQSRKSNLGYLEVTSTLRSINAVAYIFITMFIIIGVLVYYSTITIIIDDQKKLVGATKALGFFNRSIHAKYLVFGVSAVIVGNLLGIPLQAFLQMIFQQGLGDMFVYGIPGNAFVVIPAVIIAVLELVVAIFSTYAACHKLIKLPAIILLTGQTDTGKTKKKMKNANPGNGSLYSRLILRNMITDKARVIIYIFIIAGSSFLIGIGTNIRNGFASMIDKQVYEVQRYDLSISYSPEQHPEQEGKIEDILKQNGVEYDRAMQTTTIFQLGETADYATILVMNDSTSPKFIRLQDAKTKKNMTLPKDGILVQSRLFENYNMEIGDGITIYDGELHGKLTKVAGVYVNHFGRYVAMSREVYKEIYGKEAQDNIYYVLADKKTVDKITNEVKAVAPEAVINTPAKQREIYAPMIKTYNMIVGVAVFLAVIMSIFVLANLTNIFVSKKKRELIIMRVNGFSNKQTMSYLVRETVATVVMGFLIAIVLGLIFSVPIIRVIESSDTMFVRSMDIRAWAFAIGAETTFAAIINFLAFRKVKTYKVTELTR